MPESGRAKTLSALHDVVRANVPRAVNDAVRLPARGFGPLFWKVKCVVPRLYF